LAPVDRSSPEQQVRPTESLTRRTISGMLWMAWGKGAHAMLQLAVLAALARVLYPSDFGVVSAALVVIGFSGIVSHLGLGPAVVQRPLLEPRHIDTALATSIVLGLLLGGVIWLGAPAAADFFREERIEAVLRALAFVFPLQGLATLPESLLKRELRFRRLANLDVIAYAVGYGAVGIGLALAGWGIWALVAAHICQSLLKTAMLLVSQPLSFRLRIERRAFRELMYFGGGFTIARIANYLAVQGDNLVVGRALGSVALGIYGRAYQLMAAPAHGFGLVVDAVLFPAMAKVQADKPRLATAYRRGVALIALLVLPASAALIVVAPEVIQAVLGSRWADVTIPFQILAIGMLFRTSYKMSDSLARSTGAVYRRAWRQIVYAALVMTGAWVGGAYGLAGVSWGVLAAVTVNFLLMAHLSLQVAEMRWREFARAHFPAVALTAVVTPAVWMATSALRHWHTSAFVIVIVAAAIVALTCGLLIWSAPSAFLGADGQWMLGALRKFASTKAPAAPRMPSSPPYEPVTRTETGT
jgi:O-antigen/teichoic acid export membrane protein